MILIANIQPPPRGGNEGNAGFAFSIISTLKRSMGKRGLCVFHHFQRLQRAVGCESTQSMLRVWLSLTRGTPERLSLCTAFWTSCSVRKTQ